MPSIPFLPSSLNLYCFLGRARKFVIVWQWGRGGGGVLEVDVCAREQNVRACVRARRARRPFRGKRLESGGRGLPQK